MMHSGKLLAAGLAGALAVAGSLATSSTALAWEPSKPVEFIIMAGTGAEEALRYLHDKEGDEHVITATLNSFYTTPIIQEELGVDVTKFTPIGRMALDTFLLWVNADRTDITDLGSYVDAVKTAGKEWKVGGTGSGQEDSILATMMENDFGYEVTYIPFPGGGTVAKNLIGKRIESTVNRAGKTKKPACRPVYGRSSFPSPRGSHVGAGGMVGQVDEGMQDAHDGA